jgi:para-nitrobenzyl esterase
MHMVSTIDKRYLAALPVVALVPAIALLIANEPAVLADDTFKIHLPIVAKLHDLATPGPAPTAAPTLAPPPGTVVTGSGPLVGTLDSDVYRFAGVPYAAPPLGELRWRPPAPVEPWIAPRPADALGAPCPQLDDDGAVVGDEDCLTLNIWTHRSVLESGQQQPVMLFIHGGGHVQGSNGVKAGDRLLYDGTVFAREHQVVVVAINYRLGPFGFLAHPALSGEGGHTASGNYGALDQLAALQWVHDEIAAFGGDPDNVTVFGESAGSVSTCRLLVSPLARGLVHRAILMSGACVATTLERAELTGQAMVEAIGCADAEDVPACLRDLPMLEVMAEMGAAASGPDSLGRNTYDGVIDGHLLPDAPRALIEGRLHNPIPVLIGTTSAENGNSAPAIDTREQYEAAVRKYFQLAGLPSLLADRALEVYPVSDYRSPRDAYVALTSDVKFVCQARTDARLLSSDQEAGVYRYWFDHVPDNGGPQAVERGAFHGLELPFLFGVLDFSVGLGRYRPGPGDRAVAAAMQGYWARFAQTGDPNGQQAVPWPGFEQPSEAYLTLAAQPSSGEGLRSAQCDFWDSLSGR